MIKPEDYDTEEEFEEALDQIRASFYESSPEALLERIEE